jgi:large subunit ribosomal protein L4
VASPKAPLVGGAKKDVSLDEAIFAAEVKPHLVHETVRAELNARRAGTRGAKTRGLVSGGRAKPWRQKGTGRARAGTLALVDGGSFDAPSTKRALEVLGGWGQESPLLVVATEDEEALVKSFRNVDRVLVTVPEELEVAEIVWARSLLVTQAALPLVEARAAGRKAEEDAS